MYLAATGQANQVHPTTEVCVFFAQSRILLTFHLKITVTFSYLFSIKVHTPSNAMEVKCLNLGLTSVLLHIYVPTAEYSLQWETGGQKDSREKSWLHNL